MRKTCFGLLAIAVCLATGVCHAEYFGGSFVINGSTVVDGVPASMIAPTALTVDKCVASSIKLGGCDAFPVIQVVDETAHKLVCSAQGQAGPANFIPQTVEGPKVPAGDVLAVVMAAQATGCRQVNNSFSIGITYHVTP